MTSPASLHVCIVTVKQGISKKNDFAVLYHIHMCVTDVNLQAPTNGVQVPKVDE